MKSLKEVINESLHKGSMHIGEIIYVLHRDYNMSWLTPKDHPEIGKFLPHSKINDLDVDETIKNKKTAISIASGKSANSFGLALKYITTDGKLKNLDWSDMERDTLQNIVVCLRRILNDVDEKVEKEYSKHPRPADLEHELRTIVVKQTPRNFNSRNINVKVETRKPVPGGFDCIIDIIIQPDNPQQRLSIGVDESNCLRWAWQTTAGDCKKGVELPKYLIKWDDIPDKISTMLQSY